MRVSYNSIVALSLLFQTVAKCQTIYMKMCFLSLANGTYNHMNRFALGLGLKMSLIATRKLTIGFGFGSD